MISCITGLHGAGKTWFLVNKFLLPHWKNGGNVITYNPLLFSPENERITRFYQISDLYGAQKALIGFPELQRLLSPEAFRSMPANFRDLLCEHRHGQLNIVGDTQNLMFIHVDLRRHIGEVYHCRTILRLPIDETKLPIFQWIKVQRKIQRADNNGTQVLFRNVGRENSHFISTLWTKKLYDTYEKLAHSKFVIWVERVKKKWTVKMVNRELIQSGRVRKK